MKKETPLILVFYIEESEMSENIKPFVNSINDIITQKEANIIALFLSTKGESRVECVNPSIIAEADMVKINQMVEDIKTSFAIGMDIELETEEVELDTKPCDCGNNPSGNCKCN